MTFRERVRVKPGGVIEVIHPDLPAGKEVEVVVDLDPAEGTETESSASLRRPIIWETALEIGSSIPDSEWAKVPADLSKNVDHYLYGAPKS
jgi:hypothetical protein